MYLNCPSIHDPPDVHRWVGVSRGALQCQGVTGSTLLGAEDVYRLRTICKTQKA